MADIVLSDVAKRWGTFTALHPLTLTVPDGEFLVLLGPSGCGKTTTMRMVAGLEEPSQGCIAIGGRDVTDLPPKDRDVAMVFQNYGLYPHMTVAQNIGYPLKVRGIGGADRTARIEAAARKVELEALLHRRPAALSGGQRQRVALARAIVRTPQAFLMDEPLSNLDAKLRVTMRAEIKHLQDELGITTIYVTHDQIEAMTLADRVAVMNKGVIRQLSAPEALYDNPADLFVAGFIGSPPMNLLRGDLVGGSFVAQGIRVHGVATGDRSGVVLGVRPDDVSLTDPASGIAASVFACELTGEAVLLTATIENQRIAARLERRARHATGEAVGLAFDPARTVLFDAASERRIRPGD